MSIADNLARVRDEIAAACTSVGRNPADVSLMAVSKMHPVELLLEAYAAGQRLFGENRVQEWQEKSARATTLDALDMHLIGPLQSNKTARAAELFQAVDTVDSERIAQRLNEAARKLKKRLPVLVEVKLSPEASKHGVSAEELPGVLDSLARLDFLVPRGLMTVAPWPSDLARANEEARPCFARLSQLRDEAARDHPSLRELSMGMSNDFAAAIAEGSTCVRIGTAIFGRRLAT